MTATDAVVVRTMVPEDWPQVRAIYQQGIDTGNATFETAAPGWETWNQKYLAEPRLVMREGSLVRGWAALTSCATRAVYRGVAEVSIYVATEHQGKGIGSALLAALIAASEQQGIWTLQAGIFPENQASVLHQRAGFRTVGRRQRLGKWDSVWRDVLLLERRSTVAGVD